MILPMGWLLVLEVIARSLGRIDSVSAQQLTWASVLIWLSLYVALMHRAAQPYKRASRIARGLCGRCGYDMRESPQRCPECGESATSRPDAESRTHPTDSPGGMAPLNLEAVEDPID